MRALIAFQHGSKANEQVANEIKKIFEENRIKTILQAIQPKEEMRVYDYFKVFRKKKSLALKPCITDVSKFAITIIGTPVLKFGPTPIMEAYVRKLENVKGAKFALYCTPVGFAGTTIKKLAGILRTKGAKIVGTLTLSSIFELNEKKLSEARFFAQELVKQLKR